MRMMKSPWSIAAVAFAALVFGMILAGVLDIDGRGHAQSAPRAVPAVAGGSVVPASMAGADSYSVQLPNFVEINKRVSPTVVAITSTKIVKSRGRNLMPDEDFFHYFFGNPNDRNNPRRTPDEGDEQKQRAGGSGFMISPDGWIVTNNHVVEGADEVEVTISDDEKVKAKVKGTDPATDLALLKIEYSKPLPYLVLGDSDRVETGEWVMAVGYPLAYGKTVTAGVISAKGRKLGISQNSSSFENFLQTDAAINFGNSGGPLVNLRGEVIGVNTAISLQGQNIGFAVPINQFKQIQDQLRDKGKVVRGYMGVNIKDVDREVQKAFGLKEDRGALVESVQEDSPAEKAGLKHGDVILKVDSVTIKKTQDLIEYVSSKAPGTKVTLTVIRDDKEKDFIVTLSKRPSEGEDTELGEEEGGKPSTKGVAQEKLGLSTDQITSRMRDYYKLDQDVKGLLVTAVKRVSKAADAGIREGDVLMEANSHELKTSEDLDKIVSGVKKGGYVRLYVLRPGQRSVSFYALIPMEE
jgi:serine protease Do